MSGFWASGDAAQNIAQAAAATRMEFFDITSDEQTTVTISQSPVDVADVRCSVNGLFYRLGTDYSVGGAENKTVTWLDADFTLKAGDLVIVVYASV